MGNHICTRSIFIFFLFIQSPILLQGQSCDFIEGVTDSERVACGLVEVPENHEEPQGRKIQIAYVLIKAKKKSSQAYPLINFAGGPGGAGINPMRVNAWQNNPITEEHDVILFDQRGIGLSSPLPNMGKDILALMATDADEAQEQIQMNALVKRYKKICEDQGIGLEHYHSFQNARDVGMLMEHLGYPIYNISGGSYGTRLARIVQDMFPQRVHSSFINSPNPLGEDFLINRLKSYTLALSRIFSYCENDPTCNSKYPALKERYFEAIEDLQKKPIILDLKGEKFTLNAQDAIYFLRRLAYGNASRTQVPELIMAYKNRKGEIMERTVANEMNFPGFYNFSMWISVERYEMFHEENTPKNIARISKDMELLPAQLGMFTSLYTATMNHWHQKVLPLDQRDFQTSEVPTLVMVNHYDPVTPPENGYIFQKKLSNSFLYILDEGGHGGGNQACRTQVMLAFMNDPHKEPDTACLNLYKGK